MRTQKETITVTIIDGRSGDEREEEMPGRFEVCSHCRGKGTVALHAIAITADEWHGPDWDDDMREQYLSGGYDTVCECCRGQRVVLVPDRQRASKAQLRAYREARQADAEWRNEQRIERMMLGERD